MNELNFQSLGRTIRQNRDFYHTPSQPSIYTQNAEVKLSNLLSFYQTQATAMFGLARFEIPAVVNPPPTNLGQDIHTFLRIAQDPTDILFGWQTFQFYLREFYPQLTEGFETAKTQVEKDYNDFLFVANAAIQGAKDPQMQAKVYQILAQRAVKVRKSVVIKKPAFLLKENSKLLDLSPYQQSSLVISRIVFNKLDYTYEDTKREVRVSRLTPEQSSTLPKDLQYFVELITAHSGISTRNLHELFTKRFPDTWNSGPSDLCNRLRSICINRGWPFPVYALRGGPDKAHWFSAT